MEELLEVLAILDRDGGRVAAQEGKVRSGYGVLLCSRTGHRGGGK